MIKKIIEKIADRIQLAFSEQFDLFSDSINSAIEKISNTTNSAMEKNKAVLEELERKYEEINKQYFIISDGIGASINFNDVHNGELYFEKTPNMSNCLDKGLTTSLREINTLINSIHISEDEKRYLLHKKNQIVDELKNELLERMIKVDD